MSYSKTSSDPYFDKYNNKSDMEKRISRTLKQRRELERCKKIMETLTVEKLEEVFKEVWKETKGM